MWLGIVLPAPLILGYTAGLATAAGEMWVARGLVFLGAFITFMLIFRVLDQTRDVARLKADLSKADAELKRRKFAAGVTHWDAEMAMRAMRDACFKMEIVTRRLKEDA